MEVELDDLPSSQLAVRGATDLIRMVSVSGRVGGVGVGVVLIGWHCAN